VLQADREFSPERNRRLESLLQGLVPSLRSRPAAGWGEEDAQDLTQQFLSASSSANTFNRDPSEAGSLFLRTSVNTSTDEWEKLRAKNGAGGQQAISGTAWTPKHAIG